MHECTLDVLFMLFVFISRKLRRDIAFTRQAGRLMRSMRFSGQLALNSMAPDS